MKLLDLSESAIYRYRVDIDRDNKNLINDAQIWLKDNKIQAAIIPGHAFFKHKNDALLFMLRWS